MTKNMTEKIFHGEKKNSRDAEEYNFVRRYNLGQPLMTAAI
jgi:hypothetical protein